MVGGSFFGLTPETLIDAQDDFLVGRRKIVYLGMMVKVTA